MVAKKLLITLMFLLSVASLRAQSVGLTLSGGGAKGMYHIGVIKALEEYGVPIDYISGTSAGAIVGSMYAIGMTPKQMEDLFCSGQVDVWMSGRVEDKYSYYFKNSRKTATAIALPLDFKSEKTAKIPSRIIPSFQIDMGFMEYLAAADVISNGDFDKLFVPFRCNATDAVGREEVMFDSGSLPRAVRASMSIPVVFKPLRQDSVLLYDGGMMNNFPWQVLKEDLGADIIIGSKCTTGNSVASEDDLVEQVFAMMMLNTDYTLPEGGILIDRAVDASMFDFGNAAQIIELGYKDAIKHMPEILEAVGSRREDKDELTRRRMEFRSIMPILEFGDLHIDGLNEEQIEYVNKMMKIYPSKRSDKPRTFSFDKFKSEYLKLMSSGDFDTGFPEFVYNPETGLFDINLTLTTKPAFKVKVGGNVSSTALTQAYIGLEYKRLNRMSNLYYLDGYLSPMYSSVQLGSTSDFIMNVPISMNYSLNYNYYNYYRSNYGILSKGSDLSYAKTQDLFASLSFSTPLSRSSLLRVYGHAGQSRFNYFQSTELYQDTDVLDQSEITYLGTVVEFDRNTLNRYLFPTRGLSQQISAIYIAGRETFDPGTSEDYGDVSSTNIRQWVGLRFTRQQYYNPTSWLSVGYLADAVISNHPDFDNSYISNLTMPAFQPTQHSKFIYMKEFRSNSFAALGVMPSLMFSDKFYFKAEAYAFLPNNINTMKEGVKQRLRYIYSGSLVYQTIAGPASLSISKYDLSRQTTGVSNNWFLAFNFGFTIFNKNGLFY